MMAAMHVEHLQPYPVEQCAIGVRAMHPTYASFNTTASEEAAAKGTSRMAVRAEMPSSSLLTFLHSATGSKTPLTCELPIASDETLAVVKVLGWRAVQSKTEGTHIVYTILAASRVNDAIRS